MRTLTVVSLTHARRGVDGSETAALVAGAPVPRWAAASGVRKLWLLLVLISTVLAVTLAAG